MLPITTKLEPNTGADRLNVPYIALVDCPSIINRGPNFEIPVRASYVGMKKMLSVEVAGFRLMTEHIGAVPALVDRLIEGVSQSARLPHYVFIARDAGIVYPVYTIDNEVFAPTPNGPLFKHVELAKVRERLGDYLHDIRVLGANGRTDKLHVRGVDRDTLQLVRPRFYLKKRVSGEDDFWAPVFRATDARRIYAYAASARREADVDDGREVMVLRDLVANVLSHDNRLSSTHDLRVDRLFPDTWEQMKAYLTPAGEPIVVNGVAMPVFALKSGTLVALESRREEERYSLFSGSDRDDLRERAERDFSRRGIGL